MPKTLLTDILFPSKFAKWRLEGIKSFIDTKTCDIIVTKIDSYAGVPFDVDYELLKDYYNLSEYNIIIFDSKYNYLNKYNTRIDGTKFNKKDTTYSYCFTKDTTFDINSYEAVFHIFLSSYKTFNKHFPNKIQSNKQFIHLYPGGGFSNIDTLKSIPLDCNIISTQPFTSEYLKSLKFKNVLDVFGSTCLPKNAILFKKSLNKGTLKICFSTMGSSIQKGSSHFIKLVEEYTKKYPKHDIIWYYAGTLDPNLIIPKNITYVPYMSQADLDKFYSNNIDVLINTETGKALNGWPLGIEALLQGVVLITTDTHNSNEYFKYSTDMMFITTQDDSLGMCKKINELYEDRHKLLNTSASSQKHSYKHFNYTAQQAKIFEFIECQIKQVNSKAALTAYRNVCPAYFIDDCVYSLKFNTEELIHENNINIIQNDIKQSILNNLKNNIPMSLARYNDGEWIAMLRIQENNLYNTHYPKWGNSGQKFVDKHLTPIIESKPPYLIGISTEVLRKPYMMKYISDKIISLKLFDGGLFPRWSIENDFKDFIPALQHRNVIIIGPKYLSKLNINVKFKHISTDINNVWLSYDIILEQADELIRQTDNPVVLYCCSFVAKKLIDVFYYKYNNITQLDIGAAFDVYSNENTRPWHKHMRKAA